MKYAVISLAGSQHQVSLDSKLTISNLNLKEGEIATTDQILLTVDGEKVEVGVPTVTKATVEYKVLRNFQGKKIDVFKYKSKSRYRKAHGHRDMLTEIQVTKLTF